MRCAMLLLRTFVCRTRNETTTKRRLKFGALRVLGKYIRLFAFLLWALITASRRVDKHTLFFDRGEWETRLELASKGRCSIIIASRPSIRAIPFLTLCAKVKGGHADQLLFLRVLHSRKRFVIGASGVYFFQWERRRCVLNLRFAVKANLESELHCRWWWESHHDLMVFR
jgi:hypothetical protein